VVTVVLPPALAAEAGGVERFAVDGPTLDAALQALPVAHRIFDPDGELEPSVAVYVDGREVREGDGLQTALSGGETVRIVV
jgi:hypothetical protein